MKTLNIQQNTEEWLEYRKGKSGGSEFKDLYSASLPLKGVIMDFLTKESRTIPDKKHQTIPELIQLLEPRELAQLKLMGKPKKRYYEMIAERVARPITPNDYTDRLNGEPFSMMARGHILEPEIADNFAKATGKELSDFDGVWVRDNNPNSYVSPDRVIVGDDGVIREAVEIKALGSAGVIEVWKTGKIPEEYMPQVYKYFIVNKDLETLHWVVGTDVIPGLELQIITINRSDIDPYTLKEAEAYEDLILESVEADAMEIIKLGDF